MWQNFLEPLKNYHSHLNQVIHSKRIGWSMPLLLHMTQEETGGLMTLGNGAVYATSLRQKNTCNSTEAEIANLNDVLSKILWA